MRHPSNISRPLIYYDACLIFYPLQIGGAVIGYILTYVLPKTLVLIVATLVLFVCLSYSGGKTYASFFQDLALQAKSETVEPSQARESTYLLARANNAELGQSNLHLATPTANNSSSNSSGNSSGNNGNNSASGNAGRNSNRRGGGGSITFESGGVGTPIALTPTTKSLKEMQVPWLSICVMVAIWGLYIAIFVGMQFSPVCSWQVYFLLSLVYPFIMSQEWWSLRRLMNMQLPSNDIMGSAGNPIRRAFSTDDHQTALSDGPGTAASSVTKTPVTGQSNYDGNSRSPLSFSTPTKPFRRYSECVMEGDILWDQLTPAPLILGLCIGCVSELTGIGQGDIMFPLLLSLNVRPDVIIATLPVMNLMNTLTSLFHYLTLNYAPIGFCAWMCFLGFAGGLTGRHLSLWLVERTKFPSMLLMAFCAVLAASFSVEFYFLYLNWSGASFDFKFSSFC
jgi:uncharacterized membrane protein YfcA